MKNSFLDNFWIFAWTMEVTRWGKNKDSNSPSAVAEDTSSSSGFLVWKLHPDPSNSTFSWEVLIGIFTIWTLENFSLPQFVKVQWKVEMVRKWTQRGIVTPHSVEQKKSKPPTFSPSEVTQCRLGQSPFCIVTGGLIPTKTIKYNLSFLSVSVYGQSELQWLPADAIQFINLLQCNAS